MLFKIAGIIPREKNLGKGVKTVPQKDEATSTNWNF
jgi:hypothetical protein